MSRRAPAAAAVFVMLLPFHVMALESRWGGPRPADGFAGLSLRISDESVPAGSIVQIKIDVTEPKPISTGRGRVKIKGVTTVQGIALANHDQDTYGVALVEGDELTFFINSPSSLFGTPTDYPIVTIAGTVDPGASLGTTFPLTIDAAALHFTDPTGAGYPIEIKDGQLTVANGVAIGDVSPGSSIVPAGGTVRITGTNFEPDTRLQLSETVVASMNFVSSNRIDVVLGQTTDMQGVRIRARNSDDSESTYFSYERTFPIGSSNDPILGRAVPLFAPPVFTTATVHLPARAAGKRRAVRHGDGAQSTRPARPAALVGLALGTRGRSDANFSSAQTPRLTAGFALQNFNLSTVSASVELLDSSGSLYATNTVLIGPDQYLVRELSEVFGPVAWPSAVRIKSSAPLHVLGLIADHHGGTVTALPPI